MFNFGISLQGEMDNLGKHEVLKVERGQETDSVNLENKSVVTSPVSPPSSQTNNNSRLHTKKEQRSGNTLYQELSFQVSFYLFKKNIYFSDTIKLIKKSLNFYFSNHFLLHFVFKLILLFLCNGGR